MTTIEVDGSDRLKLGCIFLETINFHWMSPTKIDTKYTMYYVPTDITAAKQNCWLNLRAPLGGEHTFTTALSDAMITFVIGLNYPDD